ncbi:MAG: lipopolysaccharide biosynthesis protein, partial [Clostridium perfringens]
MRTKKAAINSSINILCFFITFIPNLLIRKVFLQSLGSELLGLNSLYTNIVGWLSIIELGIGPAIIFSLYKPYAKNDQKQIRAYIKFYGKFYKVIGFSILLGGMLLSPFLKFFINGEIDLKIATLGFILFLFNSFISYIFSHRLCILNVAQESYKITIGTTISKLLIVVLQLIMFNIYSSFILFILIQLIINFIYFITINIYIKNRFIWLYTGNEELRNVERNGLLKNVKAMFMHKIGSLVIGSTDNIVISKFIGLNILANYTNYQMIIGAVQTIIYTGLNGITASIGNMLADEDCNKAYNIHKKIFFLNFWIVSFIIISLFNTLNQFIGIWVGSEYLLDNLTYSIILINTYFALMRGSVEQFQSGSGNFYQDRYAPIFESIINLVTSVVLVKFIGISGVFIGTLISNLLVVFWTKPYVVYKYIFNKNLFEYFKMYFKYLLIGIVPLIITHNLTSSIKNSYLLKVSEEFNHV